MDPDAALEALRELAEGILSRGEDADEQGAMREELAEAFQGLDQWLSRGGFLPKAWGVRK